MNIRLSPAQRSALECAYLDDVPLVSRAWDGRDNFAVEPSTADALSSELCELSNSEDASAQHTDDADCRRYANRAARALATLMSRVSDAGAPKR